MKRTKIVCTLGPASNEVCVIKKLIEAGLDAARINFSHGTYDTHEATINALKAAREELNAPVPLILDTKGPEIRIKTFKDDQTVYLAQDAKFTLTTEDIVGDETRVAVTYADLPTDLQVGKRVLIDDGLIELRVEEIEGPEIRCVVVNSGFLSNRKGVNVPDVYVNLPSLTEKDVEDIRFGIRMGFDYIAASFVRSAADVLQIRRVLEENNGSHIQVIAKIESRDGVNNLDATLEVADGIMVARGDLGVEIPPEEVPLVQKSLIKKANLMGKPVITATQMLESMTKNPRPTRAEANDVANAIFDGSDAIMLSGETASGKYPVEAVAMMKRIALRAEASIDYAAKLFDNHFQNSTKSITNAICYATCDTAADLHAVCIVSVSRTGFSARMVARNKPVCPIAAVTRNAVSWRQLNLVWGIKPMLHDGEIDDAFATATHYAVESGLAADGDVIIVVAGIPLGRTGSTNCIRAQIVGDILAKGRGVGKGAVSGKASVVKVAEEGEKFFRPGDVLVTTNTNDDLLPFIRKAGAVVIGSDNTIDPTHAENVCKALQIPLIICDDRVVDIIKNGVNVTIDADKGFVYNGAKN